MLGCTAGNHGKQESISDKKKKKTTEKEQQVIGIEEETTDIKCCWLFCKCYNNERKSSLQSQKEGHL